MSSNERPHEVDAGCVVEGCSDDRYAHGLCQKHHWRKKRTGSVLSSRDFVVVPASSPRPAIYGSELLPPQVWRYIEATPNGCWRFSGTPSNSSGHALTTIGGRKWGLHRLTYTVHVGEIPPGLHLDHFKFPDEGCIGPRCCHPHHVRPASPWENTLRGRGPTALNKAKTHCSRCNRPLSGSNVYVNHKGRACKACRAAANRRCRARQAEARRDGAA